MTPDAPQGRNNGLDTMGARAKDVLVRSVFAALGFLLTGGAEVALIAAFQSPGHRVSPFGLGWIFMPLSAMAAGWRYGGRFDLDQIVARLQRQQRLTIGYSALWLVSCSLYFAIFDPCCRWWWGPDQWLKFTFVLFGPIGIVLLGLKITVWANEKPNG